METLSLLAKFWLLRHDMPGHLPREWQPRCSKTSVPVDGGVIPEWVEGWLWGYGSPDVYWRIEINWRGQPELVELRFCKPKFGRKRRGIRQKDLKSTSIAELEDKYADVAFADHQPDEIAAARKHIERLRQTGGRKTMTPLSLEHVARVYRSNKRAPTQAVATTFGVSHRMASVYVAQARQAGHLPPTKQGRKNADWTG
jgi:hypothetical protein